MNGNDSFSRKLENFFAGKGFYIVLAACVLVIGVSAWSLFNAGVFSPEGEAAEQPQVNAGVFDGQEPAANNEPDGVEETMERPVSVWNGTIIDRVKENLSGQTAQPKEQDGGAQQNTPAENAPSPAGSSPKGSSPAESETSELEFTAPIKGEVICGFSPDELVYNKTLADWRVHTGVDFKASIGAKVTAVSDGAVRDMYDDDMFGTTVVIKHGDGLLSIYSNLAKTPTVSKGDTVSGGDVIGAVGDTAIAETGEVSHLHFAMEKNGDVIDPFEYLPKN